MLLPSAKIRYHENSFEELNMYSETFPDSDDQPSQWQVNDNLSLTHWGRMTHLCVSKLTSIALDNGLSPGRRQAIIWTNAWILLIGP